mmetsp:Transcript_33548/g.56436  ORF Transcript_33548/g.56436 Transcript_33548/m.56436 type:complete len:83 (+) Transcript_33548:213-461(+)
MLVFASQQGLLGTGLSSKFATFYNNYALNWRATLSANRFYRRKNIETVDHLAKHDVLPIEPRRFTGAHEELRPVGVPARVGH